MSLSDLRDLRQIIQIICSKSQACDNSYFDVSHKPWNTWLHGRVVWTPPKNVRTAPIQSHEIGQTLRTAPVKRQTYKYWKALVQGMKQYHPPSGAKATVSSTCRGNSHQGPFQNSANGNKFCQRERTCYAHHADLKNEGLISAPASNTLFVRPNRYVILIFKCPRKCSIYLFLASYY